MQIVTGEKQLNNYIELFRAQIDKGHNNPCGSLYYLGSFYLQLQEGS